MFNIYVSHYQRVPDTYGDNVILLMCFIHDQQDLAATNVVIAEHAASTDVFDAGHSSWVDFERGSLGKSMKILHGFWVAWYWPRKTSGEIDEQKSR